MKNLLNDLNKKQELTICFEYYYGHGTHSNDGHFAEFDKASHLDYLHDKGIARRLKISDDESRSYVFNFGLFDTCSENALTYCKIFRALVASQRLKQPLKLGQ